VTWARRASRHPLVVPGIILGLLSAVLLSTRSEWTAIHIPMLVIGAAIVLCVYLLHERADVRLKMAAESFDEVSRDHRFRIGRLEDFRERQIRYNRNERLRVKELADRVESIEQMPLIHAARQQGGHK